MLKEGRRRRRLLFFLIQFYRCLPRGWKRTGPVPLARDLLKRSRIERNTNKRKVKLRRRSSKWTNMNSTRCTNDFPRWKMKALLLPCRPVPPILIYLAQHLIFFLKHFASLHMLHPYCPPLFPLITFFPSVDTRHFSTVSRLCKDSPSRNSCPFAEQILEKDTWSPIPYFRIWFLLSRNEFVRMKRIFNKRVFFRERKNRIFFFIGFFFRAQVSFG